MNELKEELSFALKATREEPGCSVVDVAEIIKEIFSQEEITVLLKELS